MPSNWEQLIVVANCSKRFREFVEHKAYLCPATKDGFHSSYFHTQAKYFAPYVMKGAQAVAVVDGVVRMSSQEAGEIVWNNNGVSDGELITRASAVAEQSDGVRPPCLVFLLSELRRTNFEHDSRAGFQQTRQYFDLSEFEVGGIEDVATALTKTPWSGLKKVSVK